MSIDYMSATSKHRACVAYSQHHASVTVTAAAPIEKVDLTWETLLLFLSSGPLTPIFCLSFFMHSLLFAGCMCACISVRSQAWVYMKAMIFSAAACPLLWPKAFISRALFLPA